MTDIVWKIQALKQTRIYHCTIFFFYKILTVSKKKSFNSKDSLITRHTSVVFEANCWQSFKLEMLGE